VADPTLWLPPHVRTHAARHRVPSRVRVEADAVVLGLGHALANLLVAQGLVEELPSLFPLGSGRRGGDAAGIMERESGKAPNFARRDSYPGAGAISESSHR